MMKTQDIADRICHAIEGVKSRSSAFNSIFDAFRELIIAKACFRQQLPAPETDDSFKPDPVRFSQGVSVLTGKSLTFDKIWYLKAAESLFPAMESGFPKAAQDIRAIKTAILASRLSPELFMASVLNSENEIFSKIGRELKVDPQRLHFVMGQMLNPFLEKQAEALTPLIEKLQWDKGCCPVCGAYPEASLLKGETGERWLKCSVCAQEWRFIRTKCPVCENENANDINLIFLEDRPQERAELCLSCKKYLIGFDLRKYPQGIVFEVERLGALYLDVAAQEKGCFPMGASAWNVIE